MVKTRKEQFDTSGGNVGDTIEVGVSGEFAFLPNDTGANTLAETLASGNTTDGYNVDFNSGSQIISADGYIIFNLPPGIVDPYIEFQESNTQFSRWTASTPLANVPGFISIGGNPDGQDLAIETETGFTGSGGNLFVYIGAAAIGGNGSGGSGEIVSGDGDGIGAGGSWDIIAAAGGATGDGGTIQIAAGNSSAGGASNGNGADIVLNGGQHNAGSPLSGNIDINGGGLSGTANGTAGSINLSTGFINDATGTKIAGSINLNTNNTNAGTLGTFQFQNNGATYFHIGSAELIATYPSMVVESPGTGAGTIFGFLGASSPDNNGGPLYILGGNAASGFVGGAVVLSGGYLGSFGASPPDPASITVNGVQSATEGGGIDLSSGNGNSGPGGGVSINAGGNGAGFGGAALSLGGGPSGSVSLSGGSNTGTGTVTSPTTAITAGTATSTDNQASAGTFNITGAAITSASGFAAIGGDITIIGGAAVTSGAGAATGGNIILTSGTASGGATNTAGDVVASVSTGKFKVRNGATDGNTILQVYDNASLLNILFGISGSTSHDVLMSFAAESISLTSSSLTIKSQNSPIQTSSPSLAGDIFIQAGDHTGTTGTGSKTAGSITLQAGSVAASATSTTTAGDIILNLQNANADGYGAIDFQQDGYSFATFEPDVVASFNDPVQVPSFTVATVPSATTAGRIIYVSDEAGGAVLAFSDGADWRRVTDRIIIS